MAAIPNQMSTDYQNFWKNTPVGGSADFAGGKLTRSNTNGASEGEQTGIWQGADGKQASMTAFSNLEHMAQNNPAMANQWKAQYGYVPGNDTGFQGSPAPQAQGQTAMPQQSTGGNLGMGQQAQGTQPANAGQNPYLQSQADSITKQVNNNLQRNILPGIGAGAQQAGQYGGSRQGIAEGIAAGDTSNALAGNLANLYGNAYNSDRSNATQNKSLDNQYNLGLGSLGLQGQAQQNNFYSTNRGQDLQQYQLGAQMYGQGVQGNLGIGQTQYGLGNTAQQNGYNALNQYGQNVNPYTGLNNSTTSTSGNQSNNTAGQVVGGLTAGLGLWNAYNAMG